MDGGLKPDAYTTLPDVLREHARVRPLKAAVIFEGRVHTYADLDRAAGRAAERLREAGVEPGDRVAILARNSVEYIALLFGIAKAGAAFAPLNSRLAPPEIAAILLDCEPAVLVLDPALAALAPAEAPPGLRILSVAEATGGPDAPTYAHGAAHRDDLAALVYTSGTTGQPKGAMLTHANFARHCGLAEPGVADAVALSADDVALAVLPLFHVGGLEFLMRPLFTGATLVLHQDFDVARILRDVEAHRITVMGLVPTALQIMLAHPGCASTDFSSVRRFLYGASPIPIDLLRQGVARVGCDFVQSYGMTETSGTCAMLAPRDHDDPDAPRMRAAGRPIQGAEIRIVNSDGASAALGEVGEIQVRGPGVMAGYWRRPEATAAALSADGWLRTGDAGYLDAEGYLYVHDRIKDLIISGAENIYPAEVESAIFGHPSVAEAAVVGVPDTVWGEAVKAVVVAKPGRVIDPEELIAWTRTRIAAFKAPKSVDVVSELPKNAAGKILRRTIREAYWRGRDRMID